MTPGSGGGEGWPSDDDAVVEAEDRGAADTQVSQLVPAEWARISLVDRLRGSINRSLRVQLVDGSRHQGTLAEVGDHWLLLIERDKRVLVFVHALMTLAGVGEPTPSADNHEAGRRMQAVCREWGRQRRIVTLGVRDGTHVTGSLTRVGTDTLDVVVHPFDRSASNQDERLVFANSALLWLATPD
ncbi:MAG TPA: hypothetical protein VMT88_00860 [Actinomycetes bacterium]|nr:hypothetical protein [Actinomycetes bacterium]